MKTRDMLGTAAVASAVAAMVFAGEPEKPKDDLSKGTYGNPVSDETKKQAEAEMMANMAPGPRHALLAGMAGRWRCVALHRMDPSQPEAKIEFESEGTMILGGRFLKYEAKGEFFGMPFESLTILGYDRRHEHYTVIGFDTMGTYSVAGEGPFDEATKTLRLKGSTHDPKTGATERYTFVYRDITPDSFVSELWFKTPDDKEMKVVESTCTRVK